MAKAKLAVRQKKSITTTSPTVLHAPTTHPGQVGITTPPYFFRFLPQWNTPVWYDAERWRRFVKNQPVAMVCRDSLIAAVSVLDWKVVARDPNKADELKAKTDYYTKLLTYDGSMDFAERTEWIAGDMLDLPFGGAAEIGREGDSPTGKVVWIEPLDGGTLFPTLNVDWPVGQYVPSALSSMVLDPIYFPADTIDRVYYSPRQELMRKGWGMAPPEKIYLALELLWRGDQYYANLLLDTPEAGVLDLGDMAKDSAQDWIASFRDLMSGIDAFKIPVLYEHEKPIQWIPFGKPPTDLMFDQVMVKYSALTAAGYGLSLSDIGLVVTTMSGGDTLAGKIRDERKSRQNGKALIRQKIKSFYNRIVDPELIFDWVEIDEELTQGNAKARLANATAFQLFIQSGILDRGEARRQMIADGMVTIKLEEKPPEVVPTPTTGPGNPTPNVADQVARPVSPELGGHGVVTAQSTAEEDGVRTVLYQHFDKIIRSMSDVRLRKLIRKTLHGLLPAIQRSATENDETELEILKELFDSVLDGGEDVEGYVKQALDTVATFVKAPLDFEDWWRVKPSDQEYEQMLMAYSLWFRSGAKKTLKDITDYLYEHDFIDRATVPSTIDTKDAVILALLMNRAKTLVVELNSGTETFLHRALLSGVRDTLLAAGAIDLLKQGVDIETIMSNNSLIAKITESIRSRLQLDFTNRLATIDAYEQSWTDRVAALKEMDSLGLQEEEWVHMGSDVPCDLCQRNIDAGIVKLGFKYETVFGPSEHGPAHNKCHCETRFVPSEVQRLIQTGEFPITNWRGV
jgi:hypothetical protein